MGLEIINAAGNARLVAPSIRLPASLAGARGFFAMGGEVPASRRNRVPGRLMQRPTIVGAPDASAPGYCRLRHLTNYFQTDFEDVPFFTLGCIVRAVVPFAAGSDRPVFFGNTILGGGTPGISLYFQTYTDTSFSLVGGASVDVSGTPTTANTQILNVPNPLGWKLVIFQISGTERRMTDVTDNLTTWQAEARTRVLSAERHRIGSTAQANGTVFGQADICNMIWLPGFAASESQRADIAGLLRADAALVGITA